MPDINDTKLPLTTSDLTAELLERLREVAPQVFCEGKVDFDKLKETLGEATEERAERYGLSWAGKSEAFRNVQVPSVATLLPQPAESVAWDTTENQIIEGDNLEVLKLLQKPYHGKIKMIYIDPPYNTGNEFIYPDNYREGLKDYLRYSGQVSEEGIKQSTNTETSGRFHSNWLNMMYPRLFLARNLLREDGVIFVSIDDNEVHNLRMLMNEVFGEENFVATVIWQKVYSPKNTARHFSADHDYIVVYARDAQKWMPRLLPRTEEMEARYSNPDNDPRGAWKSSDLSARNFYGAGTYPVQCPSGRVISGPPTGRYWVVSKQKFLEMDKDNRIWWGENGDNAPAQKRFLAEVKEGLVPQTLWTYKDVGHTQEAKKSLLEMVQFTDSDSVFDTPKPPRLISRMLRLATELRSGDIVLDFFAGSGTTAQAVLDLNKEDGGNRKFILVQLPEKTDNPQFPTIAHITRERVRRVIDKLDKDETGKLDLAEKQDRGFRAFKLSSSNFKIWDADTAPTDTAALAEQLKLYADNVEAARGPQDILFELILKTGLPLSSCIASIDVAGGTAYAIAAGNFLICLENSVTRDMLRAMTALNPTQMLCLDIAFHGDDALKTNTVLEARAHGIVFRTV